ncbi:hypothetical protein [Mesorhizobium sp. LNJC405B00]|uniref:hypothetical protein n=1 Tax=Mesorhizobium sp. LNJC405B00 TaxID=1287281 RepID=UPI0003CDDA07|nr:hypothetical protein [Mesorhizobium sp. LNJC405B00]ESX99112.1 hypothetical protein X755_12510 [Mesorhizobium sp. LNJC405B00]
MGDGTGAEIAKAAASTPGGLLLVGGAYSGQLAKQFPELYVNSAGMIATMAMFVGFTVLVVMAIGSTINYLRKG